MEFLFHVFWGQRNKHGPTTYFSEQIVNDSVDDFLYRLGNDKDSLSHLDSPNFASETEILRSAPLKLDFGWRENHRKAQCSVRRRNDLTGMHSNRAMGITG